MPITRFDQKNTETKRLLAHYCAFIGIFTLYGYKVCPFIDDLSIIEVIMPALAAIAMHYGIRSVSLPRMPRDDITAQAKSIFKLDWSLFTSLGLIIATYNSVIYGFPAGSGAKVTLIFIVLGLYIALDLALRRDLETAKTLSASGRDFPISARFLPYETKFMLFSAMNIAVMGLISVLVAIKDLVWVRDADLSENQIQALVFFDTSVVLSILSAYVLLVIKQYSNKIKFALDQENKTLRAVQKGDLTSRVTVVSNDEFGHLACLTNSMVSQLKRSIDEVARNKSATIQAFIALAAKRDNETGLHLTRTQIYVRLLAEHMEKSPTFRTLLDHETVETIVSAAPLHDIGKVGIPDAILCKPGRLNSDEFAIMQTHTSIGAEALHEANEKLGGSPFIHTAIEIAEFHHEKWDGTGYPHRLAGEAIPLSARIMAVADVYDAIRSQRVYKPARSHEDARNILLDGAGSHFDPQIITAFAAVEEAFEDIAERFKDHADDAQALAKNVA